MTINGIPIVIVPEIDNPIDFENMKFTDFTNEHAVEAMVSLGETKQLLLLINRAIREAENQAYEKAARCADNVVKISEMYEFKTENIKGGLFAAKSIAANIRHLKSQETP